MLPRHQDPKREDRTAHAPYNFVPLPERMVPALEPLGHDVYHEEALTGCIECVLVTCSPTYVRGMLSPQDFAQFGDKSADKLTDEEKLKQAPFFSRSQKEMEGYRKPAIPGSTLRGMVRSLVEIVAYGRMRWVAGEPPIRYRAVAAPRDDPLRDPYIDALGRYGAKVRAGYLVREGDEWRVQPALTPARMKWPEKRSYLQVKERQIDAKRLPGFSGFNSSDYRPQLHDVSFNVEVRTGKGGEYAYVSQIGTRESGFEHQGVLVCSGSMLETAPAGSTTRRRNHALVLSPDPEASRLSIDPQIVRDYRAALTPFEAEQLTAWGGKGWGCLRNGAPVFYVAEGDQVLCFGHCPNFRVPARLTQGRHAVTPRDMVPEVLRNDPRPDLADAIFGWARELDVALEGEYAGRVFFGDAVFAKEEQGLWWRPESVPPRTLSGPKPTTFQHYLVQDPRSGHDPDVKPSLAHYGTLAAETQIRGHKLYWHKGPKPDIEATKEDLEHETQLTRIMPLSPGVHFSFRIDFENLRDFELGALLWVLTLPGEEGKEYRHKLGMGKPLGMGAVHIQPTLHLSDRTSDTGRYARLFNEGGNAWHVAERDVTDLQPWIEAFEHYVLEHMDQDERANAQALKDVERIRMLLAMLEWPGPAVSDTAYMGLDEFKARPVLPDPLAVARGPVSAVRPARRPGPGPAPVRPERPTPASTRRQKAALGPDQTGQVKRFDDVKGYGFIAVDGGGDVFVHHSAVVQPKGGPLVPGQRVQFDVVDSPKGPRAQNVRVLR